MLITLATTQAPYIRRLVVVVLTVFALTAIATDARADLSSSQARKSLTRTPGFELTSGAVRVKRVTQTGPSTAEVSADIRTVFKFEQDALGRWYVAEVRTGPDHWEDIGLIAVAARTQLSPGECTAPDPPFKGRVVLDPSAKRARCLIGSLLNIDVPSDAVRIQEVAPFAVPLASQNSSVVVAWIRTDAKLVNDKKGWRVTELRTGNGPWVSVDSLVASVNEEKQRRASNELQTIAKALEQFRHDRGYYVVGENHGVVIDHLSPRYLPRVIRVDPWHQPYKYQGDRDHFTLSSSGPDGKSDTADDIRVAGSAR